MKKRIEKYFPSAMSAITTVLQNGNEEVEIAREFQGYISAFGASVLQMGLLPTLAVYADKESGAVEKKWMLLEVLAHVLMANDGVYLSSTAKTALKGREKDLFKVVIANGGIQREVTEGLLDAVVAVKLCLRTFKLSKP